MSFLQKIREKSTPKIRRTVYLVLSATATFFSFLLLFIPFCLYRGADYDDILNGVMSKLTPASAISLMKNEAALMDGMAYVALVLFLLWLAFMIFTCVLLVKMIMRFVRGEEKLQVPAKTILLSNTLATGVYFLGSIIFYIVNKAAGGYTEMVSNYLPFLLTAIVDIFYAVYVGVLKEEDLKKEKPEDEPKRKQMHRRMLELFLYATVMVGCALLAFFTEIVSVQFIDASTKQSVDYSFTMTGLDVLKNYDTLETGSQVLAFMLFLSLTIVLSFYFLALVSFLSKSTSFFRFMLGSVIASVLGCFLIGMYGKYYQMIHSVNVETLMAWLEYKILETFGGVNVNLEALKEEFLKSYEITSVSFYYFLAAMVVAGVVLARRPYSKGLSLAHELEPTFTVITAKIENAEFAYEGESHDESIPAPVVYDGNEGEISDFDPCPAFSELDSMAAETRAELEKKRAAAFEDPTLPKLVQYVVQYARDSRLHLFYTAEDIATFIAGLGTTKLTILQGMSGTGKTSLPKIFCEALFSRCDIVEVESSWRDKNELLGYYNEFSKTYTPKKFTQALYAARLHPETLTFIVLDEMNLSRIEYYFSDFLSLMENEPDKREIKLLNVGLCRTRGGRKVPYAGLMRGHTLKIPPNVWFIGTANRDESTFEISDKVYDRAHTMNFNKRAKKVRCYNQPLPQKFLSAEAFNALLEEAKKTVDFNVDAYPVIAEAEKLLAPYNISFGNRIAMQIESFVAIYCACFTPTEEVIRDAVERILLSKVVSKLELKSVEDKDELAASFEELGLPRCAEFVSKLNED